MAITKLASGPYTIHTINATDPITLDAGSVYINGNLVVLGTTSTIETTNTVIYDNIVTLNGGITGSPFVGNAGIEVNRGGGIYNNVSIGWDEVQGTWTARIADGTWKYILQSNIGSIGLTAVIDDPNPSLGGNLNLNSYTVSSNVGNMKLQGNVQINNTLVVPTSSVTNATVLYATTPNAGSTGLYVLNSSSLNEELVTKKRALGFSLIF
jgi:hypothetical protein